jgi:hypothetical protein
LNSFFDTFWAGSPNQTIHSSPQPVLAVSQPLTPPRLVLPDLKTPDDDGLTEPVRLVRAVTRNMIAQGLLEDESAPRGRSRVHRPANDRWALPRRRA